MKYREIKDKSLNTFSQDIFGFGVLHWNDWDCSQTARLNDDDAFDDDDDDGDDCGEDGDGKE